MANTKKKVGKKTANKQETEVMEMIRSLTHVPLSTIQEVLKGLAVSTALQYADALEEENQETSLVLPYIGTIEMESDQLQLDWGKHSVALNEMINVKRAAREGDDALIDVWYNRLREDLREKV